MRVRFTNLPILAALLTLGVAPSRPAIGAGVVDFERDVRPIFARACAGCHFPEAENLQAELDLSTEESALKGGAGGLSVLPGNAEESPLVAMIEHREGVAKMPPPKKGKPLGSEEIARIREWIDQAPASPAPSAPAEQVIQPVDHGSEQVAPAERHETEAPEQSKGAAPVGALAFSPDGKLLARGGLHKVEIVTLDPASGAESAIRTLEGHADLVRSLAFSSDGTLLAAAGGKPGRFGEVKIWRVADGSQAATIQGHKDNILEIAFSPDGKRVATCSYDKFIKVWDASSGAELLSLKDHVDAVYSVAYSPDGKLIASGAGDRTVKIWDAETGERLITFSDCRDAVRTVAFSPSGKLVAAGAADKMIRVWDLEASKKVFTQSSTTTGVLESSTFAHEGAVLKLVYSGDGATLYSTGEDRLVKAWATDTFTERFMLERQSDWVTAMALSPDGELLALGCFDSTRGIHSARTGERLEGVSGVSAGRMAEAAPAKPETILASLKSGEKRPSGLSVDAVVINATIPPSITSISPQRRPRGSEFEMTVEGNDLPQAEPYFTDPAVQVRVVENEALLIPEFNYDPMSTAAQVFDYARPHRLKLKVTLPADISLGEKFLIFETPLGVSNPMPLTVLARADVGEVEPNNSDSEAQTVVLAATPTTLIGAINAAGDPDLARIRGEAGQELVCALTDSAPGLALRLRDATGTVLADSDQFDPPPTARLGYRLPSSGEWILEVRDKDLRGGMGYRLHIGQFPFVHQTSQLGLRAGNSMSLGVNGFNLGGATQVAIAAPAEVHPDQTMPLPIPFVEGNPIPAPRIAVGRFPERMETPPNGTAAEAEKVSFPTTINGVIGEKGDLDLFMFSAIRGEKLVLEVSAARLGSRLDSVVEVLDTEGNPLRRGEVRCVAQTALTLADRDSKTAGLRLESWKDLRIGDYVAVGSEILRVSDLPDYNDEDALFEAYPGGQRKGHFATTPEHHAVGSPLYKVEIHPPGAEFPPNGMPVFPLYWRNDDSFYEGAMGKDSLLVFEAPSTGNYIARISDAIGGGGEDYQYRLAIRYLEPDFDISINPYRVNVPAGGRTSLSVQIVRRDGFDLPVTVEVPNLPKGLSVTPGVILPNENSVDLLLAADADAVSTTRELPWKALATYVKNGREQVKESVMGPVYVVHRDPDLAVKTDIETVAIPPGGVAKLKVTLDRFNGFTSRVPISVLNLPTGVRVLDTGLNGILVRAAENDREMEVYAEPWVSPISRTIYVQAKVESRAPGRMVFLSAPLQLRIGPEFETPPQAPSGPQVASEAAHNARPVAKVDNAPGAE
ncbi:MAG: hypothetical protein GHCLOJNM_00123 [bacterium]|nr:hypothetical protein [bacterium]